MDKSIVQPRNVFHNSKSKPCAAILPASLFVHTVETLKYAALMFRRNSNAIVDYPDYRITSFLFQGYIYF